MHLLTKCTAKKSCKMLTQKDDWPAACTEKIFAFSHISDISTQINYALIKSTSSLIILVSSFFRAFTSFMFSKYTIRLSL